MTIAYGRYRVVFRCRDAAEMEYLLKLNARQWEDE